ncbi:MAG: hypothetical protein Q8R08_00920 [bacterium]|nr:hypothetical protein [bacterium]
MQRDKKITLFLAGIITVLTVGVFVMDDERRQNREEIVRHLISQFDQTSDDQTKDALLKNAIHQIYVNRPIRVEFSSVKAEGYIDLGWFYGYDIPFAMTCGSVYDEIVDSFEHGYFDDAVTLAIEYEDSCYYDA